MESRPTTWRWSSTTPQPGSISSTRGDDLLSSTPSQLAIGAALGRPGARYAHVPLVIGADGRRLTKREGATTLAELADQGVGADAVRSALGVSLGLAEVGERVTADQLVDRFDIAMLLAHSSGPVRFDELVALIEQSRWLTAGECARIGWTVLVASVRCGPPTAPPTSDATPLATG